MVMKTAEISLRERSHILYSQLYQERLTWVDEWEQMARFVCPVRPRFGNSEINQGGRRNQWIIDGTATRAARTTVAGLVAGLTPSNRRWFQLTHPDQVLRETKAVASYLHDSTDAIHSVLSKSNFYQAMGGFYGDWVTFSNACLFVEPDKEDVVRFLPIPIGEWACANDHKGRGRTFMREFQLTVRQTVEKFCKKKDGKYDLSKIDSQIRASYEAGNTEDKVKIIHLIYPNDRYDKTEVDFSKKYISVYYERGVIKNRSYGDAGASTQQALRVSGYDRFPVLFGRWGLRPGDCYGSWGPSNIALGDVQELQYFSRMQADAVDKQVNPPMKGSTRLKKEGTIPKGGRVMWLSDPNSAATLDRIYNFIFDVDHATQLRDKIAESIKDAYYVNAFQRFISTNRSYLTAKQVGQEEKEILTELSPVLELLNYDVLSPLVDIVFEEMATANVLPEAPEELQDQILDIEYVSALHQAQRLMDATGIERFTGFAGTLAQADQSVLQILNAEELLRNYRRATSIDPNVLRSKKEVEKIRQELAEQQQAQQQIDNTAGESEIAKNLSQAEIGEDENALQAMLGR